MEIIRKSCWKLLIHQMWKETSERVSIKVTAKVGDKARGHCQNYFENVDMIGNSLGFLFNPYWHELWKQEKCSSLAPPRGIFYKTQWASQGVKLTRLMDFPRNDLTSYFWDFRAECPKKVGNFWKKLSDPKITRR